MEHTFEFRDKINGVNCIYGIKNLITKKIYVGSTVLLKKRINHHFNLLSNNHHHSIKLQRSWNKYGEGNFTFLIFEENLNPQILLKKEQQYINIFQSQKNGYNILPIAGTTFGNKWSNQAKKNYSKLKTSLKLGERVTQYTIDGIKLNEFHNIKSAAEFIGVKTSGNIGECCRNKKRSIGGYVWEFSDRNKQSQYGFHEFSHKKVTICTHCESENTTKGGFVKWNDNIKQVYRCKNCGRRFTNKRKSIIK